MNEQKRKCIKFGKDNVNTITVKIIDAMKGIYGKQFIAEKLDGTEVFLPSNLNLNKGLSKLPMGIAVKIQLTQEGNAKQASLFKIEPMKRSEFEEKSQKAKMAKYEDYL